VPDEPHMTASPLYAMGQLRRAIDSLAAGTDLGDRAQAEAKIARWRSVIAAMADGSLEAGSRTPVAGAPVWVTLEVAHGGFATGRFLAETPPDAQELVLLSRLDDGPPGLAGRERVNLWYLSDAGQQELLQMLAGDRYRVEVPEDAGLLVVAWLLEHGHYEAALDLVSELRPWMGRLRFTPRIAAEPRPAGPLVRVQTAGQVAAAMKDMRSRPQIAVMRETLSVWQPLFDRLVALWCDTVDGGLPQLAQDDAGEPGAAAVTGGWPCRRWPADWTQRRRAWLADYDEAARPHGRAGQHRSAKSNFARLRSALESCEEDSSALSGRDVGWIRRALANTITRHGAPGSPSRAALRAVQQEVMRRAAYADLARIVAARLGQFPADGGIPSLAGIAADVAGGEDQDVPEGEPVPAHLVKKASRALEAPVGELVERGIIGSGEVLAAVLPQITAQVLAADFDDPQLSTVYGQAYAAFRRRRSLLLLNLEHQVRFEELPWIAAMQPFRTASADTARAARQVLTQVTTLALTSFPQAILPNPLVSEMSTLAAQAGLSLPLVEEVAADIFMGTFTRKWALAAAVASTSLEGTLYARYYALPGQQAWTGSPRRASQVATGRWGKKTAEGFAVLCAARSGEARATGEPGRSVAVNGTILEQSQILTTHNLAVLIDSLDLRDRISSLAPGLADRAFAWLVRLLGHRPADRRAQLQAVKNAAYAWRQAICFLSLCEAPVQADALERLKGHVQAADEDFQARFRPAVDGLAHVIAGGHFDAAGFASAPGGGRRFLGWSAGPHWILSPATPRPSDRQTPDNDQS
jgi:hypothetical protein